LAVAGLTLRGAAASPNQAGEVLVGVARAGDPAVRRFHAGDSLHYEFRLIQRGAESETRVEVLHEGKTIYTSDPVAAKPDAPFSGVYRLDELVAPGQYLLGVVARSPGAKDSQVVAQWADFEVVN
jgi:hypothetical protein